MKKELKFFFITDFEKEEEYLTVMHSMGWKLKEIRFACLFIFEKCSPEEVNYRLDFRPRLGKDKDTYYQLYKDYGWEYVGVCSHFVCFRKAILDGEETDIYSDSQTKLEMIDRIFKWRFVCLLLMSFLVLWNAVHTGERNGWILSLWIMLEILYTTILIYCGIGFYRLRKCYAKGRLK
ncbi:MULTISPECIES: DUF2812 domain-containing protein [unclassified Streptococcus]|uniref:DUF2812 domain-containing protein n=1 Tax=unclassified Streptococcus TaxID=2608887 RepID=UPI0010716A41|nr:MULTISPECIES: DUF2812 domain-containing protein [unclassified Streptococcus]MBF0787126.1 DUF2812 domain-containing protein [Streptococcus sp. 19428wC2_LYSM12]MCQ9211318.1 DUF2812 domain-containing protein [Streptococcus sp. B01]MCQ9214630.1 DUF2812 domain-containing protein [Streptococcus sp. O1]TFV06010.1 DUF2812 domain-containing protein [Streptococcus sp. LYSM12]